MLQVAASICAAMLVFGMTMLYLVTVVDGMAILIVVAARIGVWQCSQYCGFANGIVPYLRFACKKKNLQVPLANNHSV